MPSSLIVRLLYGCCTAVVRQLYGGYQPESAPEEPALHLPLVNVAAPSETLEALRRSVWLRHQPDCEENYGEDGCDALFDGGTGFVGAGEQ